MQVVFRVPRRLGQSLIVLYQCILSPEHGPLKYVFRRRVCGYSPTCSEFGYEAIGRYGLMKGGWMTLKRLLRCTPWHAGGHDPVP